MERFTPAWYIELARLEKIAAATLRIRKEIENATPAPDEWAPNGISTAYLISNAAATALAEFKLGRKETFQEWGARMCS